MKGSSIGARHGTSEQGLCFTKWNLSGERFALFKVTSASHPKWTGSRHWRRFLFWALPLVSASLARCETHAVPQRSFPECCSGCVPTDATETKGKRSLGLNRHRSCSLVSELSLQETMFYTIKIGFELLETVCSSFHCDIMPYIAYARHKSQANIYQDFYNSTPRKIPPVLLVLNLAFLVHLTSTPCLLRQKYL